MSLATQIVACSSCTPTYGYFMQQYQSHFVVSSVPAFNNAIRAERPGTMLCSIGIITQMYLSIYVLIASFWMTPNQLEPAGLPFLRRVG